MARLGIITDEISEDLDHALAVARELGISNIELRSIGKRSIVDHSPDSREAVRRTIVEGGFTVNAIASPFLKCHIHGGGEAAGDTHSAPQATRDDQWAILDHSLEVAAFFDAPIVRAFSFWRVDDPLTVRDEVLEVLTEATKRTAAAGKLLGMENEYACNLATGEETAWICDRIPDRTFGVIWDPGNEAALGSQPFPNGYAAIRDRIHHVHLKDPKEIAPSPGFTRMGDGAIPYVDQFRALADNGYDGILSLETHYKIDGEFEPATRECVPPIRAMARAAGLTLN